MDDLISRSALLHEYDFMHIGPPGLARKLIENAPAVQQWISVKDRLPDKDGHYLCNYHFGEYPKMTFTQVLDYYATDIVPHFQHTLGDGSMKVTHWMPLQEPPAKLHKQKRIKCHNCNGTDEPEQYQNKGYCPNCGARVDA